MKNKNLNAPQAIGIVGLGYVGTAILKGMQQSYKIETYDKYMPSTCNNVEELCSAAKVIFVCVPTPMNESGRCDISIVESVLSELNVHCDNHLVILKSTVPPGTTERFNQDYDNFSVVFSPEFLTEANYVNDFVECNRIVLGGPLVSTRRAKEMFEKRFTDKIIIETNSTVAEMVKYTANTFLATKVSYANEIKQICDKLNISFDKVVEYATLDSRLGNTHWAVPGPDGHAGFGGSCFPKDINAMIHFMEQEGLQPKILKAVWNKNLDVRPEKDWENLIGRAVTKGEKNE